MSLIKMNIFSKPDDVLLAAEKFTEENGPGAFQKQKKAEKAAKRTEKAPKPTEKVSKPAEKLPKLIEKALKPRKTNRRVTDEDVMIDKTSKPQNSNNQTIFNNNSSHSVFDYSNSHPVYGEVESERESQTWRDCSFMIFGDDYRY